MKVGIFGAGQLARMLALAGKPLGLEFLFLDPASEACAAEVGTHLQGDYTDHVLLMQMAEQCDVITYEFENVPAETIDFISAHATVYPAPKALAIGQDRLIEKNFLRDLDIPTAPFAAVDSLSDLENAAAKIGYPAILKTRRLGYDGKGQALLRSPSDLAKAWGELMGASCILEGFVPFRREVSIIAVRSVSGEIAYYPLSENHHKGGILRVAKCSENDPLQQQAESIATRVLSGLDYVGVIAVELFDVDSHLVANEFAPRVHNSGHWTIEGAETSQFENHLRAILAMPLGRTSPVGYSAMQNFIGGMPSLKELLSLSDVHPHFYNKAPRKGRKVAHATVRAHSPEQLSGRMAHLAKLASLTDDS
ncbi:MAG: 5-(carboxyamino)imidazole ribonucleotide synthase [Methylicorpusculum sp.]|uniref:5-(carboxyamino)imidazole ribonucleotide synthase n=1 Tax=Methylicorpusculum sp. TaxID=2713644 RepID=UPI0027253218|nr:5-(carboxyamino)imidazole ribonucleotide synthase [Methylicorpusculum sp.]MDO8938842.1 5-(carboxyamino)imidazole ribonucleotide synthase [Methylicorpusculum sp.]MDO9239315.1 5-(carboxyamino)imidazole ribonucleotide synthase [Methylicorpusculum sp.]MDP2201541.1 5-(carboxyamino)imidazole ribonucleotide synthase [Methylicorpusculum sp.]